MAKRVNFTIHIFTIINKKTGGGGEKVWKGKGVEGVDAMEEAR